MQEFNSEIIYDLHRAVSDFLIDLGNIFTLETERGDLSIIELYYKRLHPERAMQHSINKLLPHKDKIQSRNISFFNQNRYIFAGLPDDRVTYYSNIILNQNRLSDEDLNCCWAHLDTMLAYTDSYNRLLQSYEDEKTSMKQITPKQITPKKAIKKNIK